MQYVIITDQVSPTHRNRDGELVRVEQYPDPPVVIPAKSPKGKPRTIPGTTVVTSNEIVTTLSGYTPLNDAERRSIKAEADYQAALAKGVEIKGVLAEPITLPASASDIGTWTSGLTVANTILGSGVPGTTVISTAFGRTVLDAAGASHDMTLAQFCQLGIGYAQQIGTLQAKRNAAIAAGA